MGSLSDRCALAKRSAGGSPSSCLLEAASLLVVSRAFRAQAASSMSGCGVHILRLRLRPPSGAPARACLGALVGNHPSLPQVRTLFDRTCLLHLTLHSSLFLAA